MVNLQRWKIPRPHSVLEVDVDANCSIYLRHHGNPSGRRIVLSHGNGLAIDLYYPFWSLLEDEFELFVFDLRNHGWNAVSSQEDHNMFSFVTDLDRVLHEINTHFGTKPLVGVFHSLATMVALLHSSHMFTQSFERRSNGFDGLVLFDPPLYRPGMSQLEFDDAAEGRANETRMRAEEFDSLDQFIEMLEFFPMFSRIVPGGRELMAETTLRKSSEGKSYQLRCPKEYEARVTEYVRAYAGEFDLASLPCPTRIIGSDPLLPRSYLPTLDLSDMLNVDFDFIPESSHFLMIEKPDECCDFVRDFILQLNQ